MLVGFVMGLSMGIVLAVGFLGYCLWRSWAERLTKPEQCRFSKLAAINSAAMRQEPQDITYH